MVSEKVSGMVVLHCSGRIHGNAYLITFKVRTLVCTRRGGGTYTCSTSFSPLSDKIKASLTCQLLELTPFIRALRKSRGCTHEDSSRSIIKWPWPPKKSAGRRPALQDSVSACTGYWPVSNQEGERTEEDAAGGRGRLHAPQNVTTTHEW
jgi:hypothetical protein